MNLFYIQAILTASIGGILYGYDMGVISGALPLLSEYFQLTPSQEEWIVSLLYFGGGVGAASGGFLCDLFGRKTAILFTDIMFGLGALLLFCAETVESVMIGRVVVGWAVAVSGIADVAYLHEISSVWDEDCSSESDKRRITEGDDSSNLQAVNADEDENEEERASNKHDQDSGGRGSVVSVNEACISLGFLLAFGVAYILGNEEQNVTGDVDSRRASDAWRLMFGFGGVIAALQFLGMLFMPESPVWLNEKGRTDDAIIARNRIRGTGGRLRIPSSSGMNQNESVIEMSAASTGTDSSSTMPSSTSETSSSSFALEEQWHTTSRDRCAGFVYLCVKIRSIPSQIKVQYQQLVQDFSPYKKQTAVAFFLAISQQFCGHPSVIGYSAELFTMLSQDSNTENDANADNNNNKDMTAMLTVGIGVLKFGITCIVILFIDKGGRIRWLLSGMSCILISLVFLCIAFSDHSGHTIENSSNIMEQQTSSSFKNDIGIVGIYGVAMGYAASYGPLTWLITSELFPSSIRGRALGFATIVTYMSAGLVSRTFLSMQQGLGLSSSFALYAVATLVSILLVWTGVPDTGGEKTPEEIEGELNDLWRHQSRCPLFLRRGSRRAGERSSSYLASLGGYGSNENNVDDSGPSLGANGDNASHNGMPPHSGLTPRRSTSSPKEIV